METITIDATAPGHPFPHYWEQMFGSGRAILSLRDSYRRDLRAVHQITDLQYIRFHGILLDDVGVYDEDKNGRPVYNFSYVDQIYDRLLAAGNIPKPSFYAMQLLHRLGDERIENSNSNVLVTKTEDGSLVVAVWDLVNPGSTRRTEDGKSCSSKACGPMPRFTAGRWTMSTEHPWRLGEDGQSALSDPGSDRGAAEPGGYVGCRQ